MNLPDNNSMPRPRREFSVFFLKVRRSLSAGLLIALFGGCGLFDSGIVWRSGPYLLIWIDTAENVSLNYELESGSSVEKISKTVFSVGADDRYVVAKQHPAGDRKITNYFIVPRKFDSYRASAANVVIGPLDETEFAKNEIEFKLPAFSKTLESLK